MFWPTSLETNVPAAPLVPSVTVSPESTPTRLAVPRPWSVAVVLPLYVLSAAVMPVTVMGSAVTTWVAVPLLPLKPVPGV